jgi:prepilin-type N-terminal cleavage/methylation domain-containing protein
MKSCKYRTGFTLVELLIVITVIAILSSLVITTAARIQSRAKEQLTENTIAILTAALEQFRDAGYNFKGQAYTELDFPPDCNGLNDSNLKTELENIFGTGSNVSISGDHEENYSGCEVLYLFLNMVPESRQVLEKIAPSLITNKDKKNDPMSVTISISGNDRTYPLLRVIDPWGTTLRYSYYKSEHENPGEPEMADRKTFPLISSAGPDKQFGTGDDISNSK